MLQNVKRCCLVVLLIGSFMLTDMFAKRMKERDPLYATILDAKSEYEVEAIDAKINGSYIIPGLNGEVVDVNKSYQKMKQVGAFRVKDLVMKEQKPHISIMNYYDKIVSNGNSSKRGVSFVTMSDDLAYTLDNEVVPYAILTTFNNYKNNYVYGTRVIIERENYDELSTYLDSIKEKNNLCYFKEELYDICLKKKKVIFTNSIIMDRNYLLNYRKIKSGDIIYLDNSLSVEGLSFIMMQIRFMGLQILPLPLLLSEGR